MALPVVAALAAPLSTLDLAYQIRAGELMFQRGEILRSDPFSFTAAGSVWLDQQWAAQIAFAAAFQLGGWALLALVRAVLVGSIFGLVFLACRSSGASMRVSGWLTLASFGVSMVGLALRPQLIGMGLFALTAWLIASRGERQRRVWLIPLLVLVWANVHGSFVFGPIVVGVAWLSDHVTNHAKAKRTFAVACACIAATAITPFGAEVWPYALSLSANPLIRRLLVEWQPTTVASFAGAAFLLSVTAVLAALVALRKSIIEDRGQLPWLLWLAGLVFLGLNAERGIAWWALAAPSVVARMPIGTRVATSRPRVSAANGVLASSVIVVGLFVLPVWRAPTSGPLPLLTDAPQRISDVVREKSKPGAHLFTAQVWGSWLEFAAPNARTFVDSRIEVFSERVWNDYLTISGAKDGWRENLDRYGVTVVALSKHAQATLIGAMGRDDRWQSVYEDEDGTVFTRK